VFSKIFAGLAAKGGKSDQLMIEATHLKAPHSGQPAKKGLFPDVLAASKVASTPNFTRSVIAQADRW
jgi:hypothetical protein